MVLKFGGSKRHQLYYLSILGPKGQRRYAPKSFNTIGPSNANFVMASATSHDAASASILSFAAIFSLPAIMTRRRYVLVSTLVHGDFCIFYFFPHCGIRIRVISGFGGMQDCRKARSRR